MKIDKYKSSYIKEHTARDGSKFYTAHIIMRGFLNILYTLHYYKYGKDLMSMNGFYSYDGFNIPHSIETLQRAKILIDSQLSDWEKQKQQEIVSTQKIKYP